MKVEIRYTADGSSTLYLPHLNEQYHSLNGAVTESEHVFLNMGFNYYEKPNPVVFEVGFGTGLNALLTADRARITEQSVYYIAIENFPLDKAMIELLDYGRFVPDQGKEVFTALHECNWNEPVTITPYFRLLKVKSDFTENDWKLPVNYDIVYFDAFGPDKQPDMWTQQIFSRLYEQLLPGGILVTYSAKGEVRRRLNVAGFITERLPGPPGKKEMIRAIK
jgi:tRNA U34 5-methylaminomethyl-2-thiouridine-forming methyltransferase MnmC